VALQALLNLIIAVPVERLIGSICHECLDHVIVLNEHAATLTELADGPEQTAGHVSWRDAPIGIGPLRISRIRSTPTEQIGETISVQPRARAAPRGARSGGACEGGRGACVEIQFTSWPRENPSSGAAG
jgi:hypothetical protein